MVLNFLVKLGANVTLSIVLLALVVSTVSDYKFIFLDWKMVEYQTAVFSRNSAFSKALQRNYLNIPKPRYIEEHQKLPCSSIADNAFLLQVQIMKLYAMQHLSKEKHIFNYHLSKMNSRKRVWSTCKQVLMNIYFYHVISYYVITKYCRKDRTNKLCTI